jgi:hypothetical protein
MDRGIVGTKKLCPVCGTEFTLTIRAPHQVYCKKKCNQAAVRMRKRQPAALVAVATLPPKKGGTKTIPCLKCEKLFISSGKGHRRCPVCLDDEDRLAHAFT